MVVVSILLVFFSITLINYNRTSAETIFNNTISEVVDVMQTAKQKARANEMQNCGRAPDPTYVFLGYRVRIQPSSYLIQVRCQINGSPAWTHLQSYNVPTSVELLLGNPANVAAIFNPTTSADIANNFCMTVRSKSLNTNNCVNISVNDLGVIQVSNKATCTVENC